MCSCEDRGSAKTKYGVSDNAVRKWVRAYEREVLDEAA
jgi:hypothetical protein